MDEQKDMELDGLDEEAMGYDTISLIDEDGKEIEFRIIDCCEVDAKEYMALTPVEDDPEAKLQSDASLLLLRVADDPDENGDQYLDTINDDDEYARVAEVFTNRLSEEYDISPADD